MADPHTRRRASELRNRAYQLEREASHERDPTRVWHLRDLATASRKAAEQLAPPNTGAAEAARQLIEHLASLNMGKK
jgi:hypothetical protein